MVKDVSLHNVTSMLCILCVCQGFRNRLNIFCIELRGFCIKMRGGGVWLQKFKAKLKHEDEEEPASTGKFD